MYTWLKRHRFMSFGKLPTMKNGFSWHTVNQMLTSLPHQPAGWTSTSCSSGPLRDVQPRAFSLMGNRFFFLSKILGRIFFPVKMYVQDFSCRASFFPSALGWHGFYHADRWTVLSRGGNMRQERRLQPLPHANYTKFSEMYYLFEFSCLHT